MPNHREESEKKGRKEALELANKLNLPTPVNGDLSGESLWETLSKLHDCRRAKEAELYSGLVKQVRESHKDQKCWPI